MKLIIAGTRTITSMTLLEQALVASKFLEEKITEVVSGGASGVDVLGKEWAKKNGIPVKCFPADWPKYGKGAGPIRNKQMAEYVGSEGALLALWDGKSHGTKHMAFVAKAVGMRVKVYKPKGK